MTSQGWWLRATDGATWAIHDHAMDFAAGPELSEAMGIGPVYQRVLSRSLRPTPSNEDRREVVLAVLRAGFIRVRQYGTTYSFEFSLETTEAAPAIGLFGTQQLGDWATVHLGRTLDGFTRLVDELMFFSEFRKRYCTPDLTSDLLKG